MYHDSTEVDEQKDPIHVDVKRLIADSEGAGRCRGSFGSEVVYTTKRSPMTIAYSFEGHENPARGVRGGLPGSPSDGWMVDRDGARVEIPMATAMEIQPGERVLSRTGGGRLRRSAHARAVARCRGCARGLVARARAVGLRCRRAGRCPGELVLDGPATAVERAGRSA